MTNALQRSMSATGAALRRSFQERFAEPAALRRILRRAELARIATDLPGFETGAFERGAAILANKLTLAGRTLEATPEAMWSRAAPSEAFARAAQRFGWLEDLSAVGGDAAAQWASNAALAWIDAHQSFTPRAWGAAPSAERLLMWIAHGGLLMGETLDDASAARIQRAIWAHVEWMERGTAASPLALDRLRAGAALSAAALAIEGLSGRQAPAFAAIDSALEAGLNADGGWISRSPTDLYDALSLLRLLDRYLDLFGVSIPESWPEAAERMARALRCFRLGDGGLPCAHGGVELSDGRLDAVLAPARGDKTAPESLPDTRFERMACARALAVIDVGASPGDANPEAGAAGALAIEFSVGRRRLIVNCGPALGEDAGARLAFRGEPAHSTLTVGDAAFCERAVALDGDGVALFGPEVFDVERKDDESGQWLLARHDGYVARYGLTVSRRLFLSADGGDFRGEDSLSTESDVDTLLFRRVLEKLPRARRDRGVQVAARFHLHPDVSATMVADGEAATLRLPHGEVWVMRQSGGALSFEESRYAGRDDRGEPTRQIVVRAAARRELTQIRWAFRRIGELSQLPRDLAALGVSIEDERFDTAS